MNNNGPDMYTSTKIIILVVFFMAMYWTGIWYPDLPFVPTIKNPFVRRTP